MEQISEITTIFRRVQNVVKYEPSSLKLLGFVEGHHQAAQKISGVGEFWSLVSLSLSLRKFSGPYLRNEQSY